MKSLHRRLTVIITLFVIILLISTSCRKTVKYYDQFGRLTTSMQMKHDIPDGVTQLFFNDGITILQETHYKKGTLDGYSTRWYFLGGKEFEEFYINGKLHGKKSSWTKGGLLVVEDNYDHGLLNGNCRKWYNNGQLQIDSFYSQGMPDSIWHYFDYYGLDVGFAVFDNGNGQQVAISPDNSIKITYYSDGEQVRDSIFPYSNDSYKNLKKLCVK